MLRRPRQVDDGPGGDALAHHLGHERVTRAGGDDERQTLAERREAEVQLDVVDRAADAGAELDAVEREAQPLSPAEQQPRLTFGRLAAQRDREIHGRRGAGDGWWSAGEELDGEGGRSVDLAPQRDGPVFSDRQLDARLDHAVVDERESADRLRRVGGDRDQLDAHLAADAAVGQRGVAEVETKRTHAEGQAVREPLIGDGRRSGAPPERQPGRQGDVARRSAGRPGRRPRPSRTRSGGCRGDP